MDANSWLENFSIEHQSPMPDSDIPLSDMSSDSTPICHPAAMWSKRQSTTSIHQEARL